MTDIKRNGETNVDVEFEVYTNGSIIQADDAVNTFQKLSNDQLSTNIGFPVSGLLYVVSFSLGLFVNVSISKKQTTTHCLKHRTSDVSVFYAGIDL